MRVSQQESYAFEFGHFIPQLAALLGNADLDCFVSKTAAKKLGFDFDKFEIIPVEMGGHPFTWVK